MNTPHVIASYSQMLPNRVILYVWIAYRAESIKIGSHFINKGSNPENHPEVLLDGCAALWETREGMCLDASHLWQSTRNDTTNTESEWYICRSDTKMYTILYLMCLLPNSGFNELPLKFILIYLRYVCDLTTNCRYSIKFFYAFIPLCNN